MLYFSFKSFKHRLILTSLSPQDDNDTEEEEEPPTPVSPPGPPEWLLEVPEDLDMLIVQRHFEEAYNLIEKTREYLDEASQGLSNLGSLVVITLAVHAAGPWFEARWQS